MDLFTLPKSYENREMGCLYQYIEENRQRIYAALIICAVWYVLIMLPYHTIIKPSRPEYVAKSYIKYLKNKDYDKAQEYYMNIPEGVFTGSYFVEDALRNKYEKASAIQVKEVAPSKITGAYDVQFQVEQQYKTLEHTVLLYNTGTSILGLRKEWRILFPFRTQDICIKGIEGTSIFIDDVEAGIIKSGEIKIPGVIWGKHRFRGSISDVGKSDVIETEINDYTNALELYIKPEYGFKKDMDELVSNFSKGWSEYCLSQDGDKIKPYVTDRLFEKYTNNPDMFNGSKYVICQYNLEFLDLSISGPGSASYTVDGKWHLKEVITDKDMVFKDTSKEELEQDQYIKWKYRIVNDSGKWKIDSAEQLSFKQDIRR